MRSARTAVLRRTARPAACSQMPACSFFLCCGAPPLANSSSPDDEYTNCGIGTPRSRCFCGESDAAVVPGTCCENAFVSSPARLSGLALRGTSPALPPVVASSTPLRSVLGTSCGPSVFAAWNPVRVGDRAPCSRDLAVARSAQVLSKNCNTRAQRKYFCRIEFVFGVTSRATASSAKAFAIVCSPCSVGNSSGALAPLFTAVAC
mmetsp:Transcript_6077/g.15011  ORF Transcript_6077/g.15011 Transcript_6077/m.15011 type:complete len:205 (-) Transcript_6077:591-1205(-)